MSFGDLHPFFVHFPIAFFILIFIIEGIRLFTDRIHPMVSLIILFLGTILAFLAVQSGESESVDAELALDKISPVYEQFGYDLNPHPIDVLKNKIEAHEKAGNRVMWGSIIIFFIWLFLYLKSQDSMYYKYCKIILILILIAFVLQSAISGGELVREHGIGGPHFELPPPQHLIQGS